MRRYRASRTAWIVTTTIFGGFTALSGYGYIFQHPSWWPAVMVTVAMWTFVILWLVRFEIDIGDGEISFRSLFGGVTQMQSNDVRLVRIAWDIGNGMQGPLRLRVESKQPKVVSRLDINAQVFSRAAIQAALQFGRTVGSADDGGLSDGVVVRALRRAGALRRGQRPL